MQFTTFKANGFSMSHAKTLLSPLTVNESSAPKRTWPCSLLKLGGMEIPRR